MKEVNYKKYHVTHLTLDSLYSGSEAARETLSDNICGIILVEAPVTLNTIKARLREAFDVAKISQKALDIIEEILVEKKFPKTDNLYDVTYWPIRGQFNVDYLRISDRQIYDIPKEELKNVVISLAKNNNGEELKRAILAYFNLQVLTAKASEYLDYVIKYTLR